MPFNRLKKQLSQSITGLPQVKLAVVGDFSTQLLVQALKGAGVEQAVVFDVYEADYDQVELQIQNPASELYSSAPAFVLLFLSSEHLLAEFQRTPATGRSTFADEKIGQMRSYVSSIHQQLPTARIIVSNFTLLNDSVFGNYALKHEASFPFQLGKLNQLLASLASETPNLFINDLLSLQAQHGNVTYDAKWSISASMPYSLDFLAAVALNTTRIILTATGRFKKCLILDLDNTMWGGIIGDDGMENIQLGDLGVGKAFTNLQLWAKELQQRGIILAVCSKNDQTIAREPFEKHPDMVLRTDDISVFIANWQNKVDNIKHIQSILNIGFDSMVFLDDNPFERNLVRSSIPGIEVPELPEDPAEYLPYLRTLGLFETTSVSDNDNERTKQYQEEAKRVTLRSNFASMDEYLQSLQMKAVMKPFDAFHVPRIAQLTLRSNQFNLRTVRYSESEITSLLTSKDHFTRYVELSDRFGEYGLISLVIIKKRSAVEWFIDTWIMSCRVLSRGVEALLLNEFVALAKNEGVKTITGEYLPTPKNKLVEHHYRDLGFSECTGSWKLDVSSYKPLRVSISA